MNENNFDETAITSQMIERNDERSNCIIYDLFIRRIAYNLLIRRNIYLQTKEQVFRVFCIGVSRG